MNAAAPLKIVRHHDMMHIIDPICWNMVGHAGTDWRLVGWRWF